MSSRAFAENESVLDPSGTAPTPHTESAFGSRRARREREAREALEHANSAGVADLAEDSASAAPANTELLSRRERRHAAQQQPDGLAAALPASRDDDIELRLTRRARRRAAQSVASASTAGAPEVAEVENIDDGGDAARAAETAEVAEAADVVETAEIVEMADVVDESPEADELIAVVEPAEAADAAQSREPEIVNAPRATTEHAAVDPGEVPTTTKSFEEIIAGAFPIEEASSVPDDVPAEDDEPANEATAAANGEPNAAANPRRGRHGASSSAPVDPPRSPRSIRRLATKTMSISALLAVGLMTVATSVPANALLSADEVQAQKRQSLERQDYAAGQAQSMVNTASADVAVQRDTYGALSATQAATELGINPENTFTNDPNGTVQWPFSVGVHIGSGYGSRPGCSLGCSTNHLGQDFNPGYGAPIQAIADGVVVESTDAGGGFGVKIVIEHVIDGQMIHSLYGHMVPGSRTVQVGDHVSVGQIIGKTGNTGISTGPHLHFEILIGGTKHVDPLAWLYENTN
ncbi:peptidoglycan DD-metalloendopeptidase family protein [Paramicrobacterium agarici]|uniref:Murein DD-endopeptidase MepM/ murein hydrolase activator NlpD n=1 Tax=Paramicrobacterium agarici TaxID=630514 RepID=A0A2A9DRJ3_9MICO|nr:peptidoglycan DD-metalloendopeptidase family protein [Microbacterium agarici]PFG29213.1 murein DD-endopeptidase MepM/ murein hydrolase activator NlpD [Microbacterium agarici]